MVNSTLFEGIDEKIYIKNPNKIDDNINECLNGIKEDFCFLVCGHWMNGERGQDRKDIHMTIETFLQTFKDMSKKNQPALILKTGVSFSVPEKIMIESKVKNIKQQYGDKAPNVYIVWGDLTDHEINSLYNHKKVKAMLSLTHGEGYGRPLAEFSITGKPVVVSDWSGHKDFISKYGILVPGELKNVHESSANNMLLKESQWFNINTDIASRAMKDVFKNYKKYWEKSRKQTQYLKNNYSFDSMCDLLKGYLDKHIGEIKAAPKNVPIQIPTLPKLQPIKEQKPQELPKIQFEKVYSDSNIITELLKNFKKVILNVFQSDPNIADINFEAIKEMGKQIGNKDPFSAKINELSEEKWLEQIISYAQAKPSNEWSDSDYDEAILKIEEMGDVQSCQVNPLKPVFLFCEV